jgi:hypothetical protein
LASDPTGFGGVSGSDSNFVSKRDARIGHDD